jgi:lipoprotein LprG
LRLHSGILILIATVSLLLAGCGRTGLADATPTPTPTPAELSNRIADATSASESVHFTLVLSGKPVYADTNNLFIVSSVEGDMQRPDSALATLKVRSALTVAEVRLVSLDGRIYATNPVTRQWQCFEPGQVFDPVVLFDDKTGVTYLLRNALEDITLVGQEELAGIPHYHLRGTIAAETLSDITYGLLGVGLVQVDLWADVESLRVTQVVMVDSGTDPENPSTWTMTFSDYDKEVDVHAPVEACP